MRDPVFDKSSIFAGKYIPGFFHKFLYLWNKKEGKEESTEESNGDKYSYEFPRVEFQNLLIPIRAQYQIDISKNCADFFCA